MKNKLVIKVEAATICLKLKRDSKMIDTEEWQEEGNLSQTLLARLDQLLVRNQLKVTELDPDIVVKADNSSYTSARIAKMVAETIKYSLS